MTDTGCGACQTRRDAELVNDQCATHCATCRLRRDLAGFTGACEDHWWDEQRRRDGAGETVHPLALAYLHDRASRPTDGSGGWVP